MRCGRFRRERWSYQQVLRRWGSNGHFREPGFRILDRTKVEREIEVEVEAEEVDEEDSIFEEVAEELEELVEEIKED